MFLVDVMCLRCVWLAAAGSDMFTPQPADVAGSLHNYALLCNWVCISRLFVNAPSCHYPLLRRHKQLFSNLSVDYAETCPLVPDHASSTTEVLIDSLVVRHLASWAVAVVESAAELLCRWLSSPRPCSDGIHRRQIWRFNPRILDMQLSATANRDSRRQCRRLERFGYLQLSSARS